MDGTYAFVYSGVFGIGIGLFTLRQGRVAGTDCGGGRYEGVATEDPTSGEITMTFDVFRPRGISLTLGASLPVLPNKSVKLTWPAAFGNGQPVRVDIPPEIVNVMVRRVPDEFAPYARDFSLASLRGRDNRVSEQRRARTDRREISGRRIGERRVRKANWTGFERRSGADRRQNEGHRRASSDRRTGG
jgi:hypothetical protein